MNAEDEVLTASFNRENSSQSTVNKQKERITKVFGLCWFIAM